MAVKKRTLAQWGLVLLVLPYAAFALSSAGAEVLHQLGSTANVKERSAPIFFIVHAVAGTVALIAGPLQWILARRAKTVSVHRLVGRAYVIGVLIGAVAALRMAVTFDVPVAARLSFATLAVVWTTVTGIGWRRILGGAEASHRAWMTRSYSLTLFFLTLPIATEVAEGGVWRYEVAYPVAVSLAWMVNLAIAEIWVRMPALRQASRTRPTASPAATT